MEAVKFKTVIDESHILSLELPADFPQGEADVIVLSGRTDPPSSREPFEEWLDRWISCLPPVPHLTIEQMSRDSIYE